MLSAVSDVTCPFPGLQRTYFLRMTFCAWGYVRRHCDFTIVRQKSNCSSSRIRPSWPKVTYIETASRSWFGKRLQMLLLSSSGSIWTSPLPWPRKYEVALFFASTSILLPARTKKDTSAIWTPTIKRPFSSFLSVKASSSERLPGGSIVNAFCTTRRFCLS